MNKKLEVALITTDQLHNEFDKIKELIKNELLKEINENTARTEHKHRRNSAYY